MASGAANQAVPRLQCHGAHPAPDYLLGVCGCVVYYFMFYISLCMFYCILKINYYIYSIINCIMYYFSSIMYYFVKVCGLPMFYTPGLLCFIIILLQVCGLPAHPALLLPAPHPVPRPHVCAGGISLP